MRLDKLTVKAQEAIQAAQSLADQNNHQAIEPELEPEPEPTPVTSTSKKPPRPPPKKATPKPLPEPEPPQPEPPKPMGPAWSELSTAKKLQALKAACPSTPCAQTLAKETATWATRDVAGMAQFKTDLEACHRTCGKP